MFLTKKPDAITLMSAMKPVLLPTVAQPLAARSQAGPRVGARIGTCQIARHFPKSTLKALKHVMAE